MKTQRLVTAALMLSVGVAVAENATHGQKPQPASSNLIDKQSVSNTAALARDVILGTLGLGAQAIAALVSEPYANAPAPGEKTLSSPSALDRVLDAVPLGNLGDRLKDALTSTELGSDDTYSDRPQDNRETPTQDTHETPTQDTHEAPTQDAHEAPTQDAHEAPAPETHEAPAPETHEAPAPETHEAPASESHESSEEGGGESSEGGSSE